MSSKSLVMGGMVIGSTIGGFIPSAWGGDIMAMTLWSAIGGFAGIWAGFKLSKTLS